jgi:hypothetical protein
MMYKRPRDGESLGPLIGAYHLGAMIKIECRIHPELRWYRGKVIFRP